MLCYGFFYLVYPPHLCRFLFDPLNHSLLPPEFYPWSEPFLLTLIPDTRSLTLLKPRMRLGYNFGEIKRMGEFCLSSELILKAVSSASLSNVLQADGECGKTFRATATCFVHSSFGLATDNPADDTAHWDYSRRLGVTRRLRDISRLRPKSNPCRNERSRRYSMNRG